MAKGDGRGGNHGGAGNGRRPAHEIGPADITLGRLILLAREGNRQAVRDELAQISESEIVLGRAAQCVRAGSLQSAIKILDGEFLRVFGEGADADVRVRQAERNARLQARRDENTPLADTGLPARIVNGLEFVFDCITAGDVCRFSAEELMLSRRGGNIGPVAIKQIRAELAKLGLALRGEDVPATAGIADTSDDDATDGGESDSDESDDSL